MARSNELLQGKTELDLVLKNCDLIKKFCVCDQGKIKNDILLKKCDELIESANQMYEIVKVSLGRTSQENNPKIDGFLMYLRVLTSFTEIFVNQINKSNKIDCDLLEMFTAIFLYKDLVLEVHRALTNEFEENSNLLTTSQDPLFSTYSLFWLDKTIRNWYNFLTFSIAILYRLPFSLPVLWSYKSMGTHVHKAIKNVYLDYPFSVWHIAENPFISKFLKSVINRKVPVKSETLQISRQERFVLDCKGNILDYDKMSEKEKDAFKNDKFQQDRLSAPGKRHRNYETVECRFSQMVSKEKALESLEKVKTKRKKPYVFNALKYHTVRRSSEMEDGRKELPNDEVNPEKTLVIYIHGGAFHVLGSTSLEIYLREIVGDLAGIPMLAINYSLAVPYPICNQDVLDVYLWAVSGSDDVKQKLGFIPEKLVISGDSAGSFLSLVMVMMLNDINKSLKNGTTILMPKSIVLPYPLYSLNHMSASKSRELLDPLISLNMHMLVISVYCANISTVAEFKEIEKTDLFKQIANKNEGLTNNNNNVDEVDFEKMDTKMKDAFENKKVGVMKEKSEPKPGDAWFHVDYATYKNYVEYISSLYNHPYICPPIYKEKFNELKDISLWILVGEKDFFLDDAIELATKDWKGKVTLDIMEDLSHGYLIFNINQTNRDATQLTITRFQEACGLL